MNQTKVSADPAGRAGFALIRVAGAAAALPDPRFRIQGPDERAPYLGAQGWQPADILLKPRGAWSDGDDLVLEIGPDIVDLVEDGTVGFSLPAARLNITLIWPSLTPSRGSGGSVFLPDQKPAQNDVRTTGTIAAGNIITVPEVANQPDVTVQTPLTVTPEFSEPEQSRLNNIKEPEPLPRPIWQKPAVIAGGLAAFVIVVVAGWHLLHRTPQPVPFNAGITTQTANTSTNQPQAAACDQSPYPAVLQCEHDPARLYQIGTGRMQQGDPVTATELYQAAANGGYGPAALALAKLYDPATFQPNAAIAQADAGQAARYYRMAANDNDADAAAPRARLYQLLQTRAAQGDINAPNWLSDYWP